MSTEFVIRTKVSKNLNKPGTPKADRLTLEKLDDEVHYAIQENHTGEGFRIIANPYGCHDLEVITVWHCQADKALDRLRERLKALNVEEIYYKQESEDSWAVVVRRLNKDQTMAVQRTLSLVVVNWSHLAGFAAVLADSDSKFSFKDVTYFGHDLCVWSGSSTTSGSRTHPTPYQLLGRLIGRYSGIPVSVELWGDGLAGETWTYITTRPTEDQVQEIRKAQERCQKAANSIV